MEDHNLRAERLNLITGIMWTIVPNNGSSIKMQILWFVVWPQPLLESLPNEADSDENQTGHSYSSSCPVPPMGHKSDAL
jgi:hypothetical protein